MKRSVFIYLSLLIASFSRTSGGEKLIFTPHWLPQAQFAGFYVAQEKGFYKEAGLDVEIIHPPASINALYYLREGRADIISLFLMTALEAALNDIPIVNIAQLSQHSAILFVSKKGGGVETLADFQGKKVGIWKSGFQEVPRAMLDEHNITVEWIPILSTVNLFLLGGIDVLTVMWYNEYDQIYLSGVDREEMNTFFMSDFGYNIPEDGLYVLQNTAETRPEVLRAFVEASFKGWEYAANNREYTVKLVVELMRQANIPSNIAHQRWMLDKIIEVQNTDNKQVRPAQLHADDFAKAVVIIEKSWSTTFPIKYEEFHRPVISPFREN